MRFSFLSLSALATLSFSSVSFADSVNVQLFKSPYNLNYGMIESGIHDNAPWDEKSFQPKYFLSADYHYVKDPLVVINTTTNTRVRTLVNSVHTTLEVTARGADARGIYAIADASLWVDGQRIYEASGLGVRIVAGAG